MYSDKANYSQREVTPHNLNYHLTDEATECVGFVRMKGSQLMCAIQCDAMLKQRVLGVYARDTVPHLSPDMLRTGVGFIANTDRAGSKGQHWIAVYIKGTEAILFDSLADHSVNTVFQNYLKLYVTTYQYNTEQLQSTTSNACGFYCLYFLLYKIKGHASLMQIIQTFNVSDREYNDDFVCEYIRKYFKYCNETCIV